MSCCTRVIHLRREITFLDQRTHAFFWNNIIKEVKRRDKVACVVIDGNRVGSIENLIRRIIRSAVQETSADRQ